MTRRRGDAEIGAEDVHFGLISGLIAQGVCPTNGELAAEFGVSAADVERGLRELAEMHGVVLHPHVCEPWIVHPFSTTPTMHWVENGRLGWWAPCTWCALGIATLVGGEVRIHTRIGAESDTLMITVQDGEVRDAGGLWVHFAVPPARAWDNVHLHCALVLVFRSHQEIRDWCGRHAIAPGEIVPLEQVARFARAWYGRHAREDWRKWTVAEAQEILRESGLVGPFWDLGARSGRY